MRISTSAQANPEGPAPTMATFLPVSVPGWISTPFSRRSYSQANDSSTPMSTGSPIFFRTHAPSHNLSCGQTLPHISGRKFVFRKTLAASKNLPSSIKNSARDISLPAGHARRQAAISWQWMQRDASCFAHSASRGARPSLKSFTRSSTGRVGKPREGRWMRALRSITK
jgi:hypothetical protein